MEKKILVVDDEKSVITALHRELYPWTVEHGVEIITADSGDTAYRMVEADPKGIALLISDQRMPGLSGTDLLAKVNVSYPKIITMLLSGYSETRDMIQAIKSGAFSYILKPWNRYQLLNEVRNAFDFYLSREREERNQENLHDDLTWAGDLQRKLLQVEFPKDDRVIYSVQSEPASEFGMSGDYYDVIRLDQDRHLILLADVAGHGVKSAFLTFVLKTLLNTEQVLDLIGADSRVVDLVEWANKRLCQDLREIPDLVVTFAACLIDLARMQITFVNAGIPYFYIIRSNRAVPIKFPGAPLGFMAEMKYEQYVEPITPGQRLLFLTDGIVDELQTVTLDKKPSEETSDEDLTLPTVQQIILSMSSVEPFAAAFVDAVKSTVGIREFPDDVTVITAQIRA